jgi:hypothetical protein
VTRVASAACVDQSRFSIIRDILYSRVGTAPAPLGLTSGVAAEAARQSGRAAIGGYNEAHASTCVNCVGSIVGGMRRSGAAAFGQRLIV